MTTIGYTTDDEYSAYAISRGYMLTGDPIVQLQLALDWLELHPFKGSKTDPSQSLYKDLLEIADTYREIANYKLIFTKLDETITYGNILNIKLYSGAKLSYMTSGQNVPDDIEVFDTQKIVKQLLGGR